MCGSSLEDILDERFFVYRMEFDKTRWPCSSDSDQTCTNKSQNSARVNFCLDLVQLFPVRSPGTNRIHCTERKENSEGKNINFSHLKVISNQDL